MTQKSLSWHLVHSPAWQVLEASIAALVLAALAVPLFLVFRFRPRPRSKTPQKLLVFLSGASVEFLQEKRGKILWELQEFDVNGYFQKVLFGFFPMPKRNQRITISDRFDAVEFHPFFGIFYYTTAAWMVFYLSILCVREGVTHLRVNEGYYHGLIIYLISRITKVPFCLSVHTDFDKYDELSGGQSKPTIFGSKELADGLYGFVISRAYLVYALSDYLKAFCLRKGARPGSVRVVRNAVEQDMVRISDSRVEEIKVSRQMPPPPTVLYVGRLHKEKGILELPRIAREILELEKNAVFLVAGGGPHRKELEEAIDREGVQASFRVLGNCSHEEVIALCRLCDVMFCPVSGFVLIEAALTGGAAIVGYDIEWQKEIIEDGVTGFIVPEGDRKSAANRIVRLFRDPALRRDFAGRMREKAAPMHMFPAAYGFRREFYEELRAAPRPFTFF